MKQKTALLCAFVAAAAITVPIGGVVAAAAPTTAVPAAPSAPAGDDDDRRRPPSSVRSNRLGARGPDPTFGTGFGTGRTAMPAPSAWLATRSVMR